MQCARVYARYMHAASGRMRTELHAFSGEQVTAMPGVTYMRREETGWQAVSGVGDGNATSCRGRVCSAATAMGQNKLNHALCARVPLSSG